MALSLADFPTKAGKGIYRSKVRKYNNRLNLYICRDHVDECGLQEDMTYIARIRRICDAYTEDNVVLTLKAENDRDHPMRAVLPADSGFSAGSKVYIRLTPLDIEKWFDRKNSKGFDVDGEGEE